LCPGRSPCPAGGTAYETADFAGIASSPFGESTQALTSGAVRLTEVSENGDAIRLSDHELPVLSWPEAISPALAS